MSATKRRRCARRQGVPVGTDAAAQLGRANDKPRRREGQDNGEESSQGRQEEGRQEAVSHLAQKRKGGRLMRPLFYFYADTKDTRVLLLVPVPDQNAIDHIAETHAI